MGDSGVPEEAWDPILLTLDHPLLPSLSPLRCPFPGFYSLTKLTHVCSRLQRECGVVERELASGTREAGSETQFCPDQLLNLNGNLKPLSLGFQVYGVGLSLRPRPDIP